MRVFLGMILGAQLLVAGVYVYDFNVDLDRRQRRGRAGQSHHRELGCRGDRLDRTETARA